MSFFGFGEKQVLDDKFIRSMVSKFRMKVLGWNFKSRRLIIEVDWIDKFDGGETDRLIKAIQKTGLASNITVVDPRGHYVKRFLFSTSASEGMNNRFEVGVMETSDSIKQAALDAMKTMR